MNKTYKVNYLARDFQSIKQELSNYAKRYYPNNFSDLSEASINSFFIDMAAYVGDVLSYYTDYQANESFLATAIEEKNILQLAKSLGYKQSDFKTTTGKVAVYMLVPSVNNTADYTKVPIIKKGTVVSSADGTKDYLINEDIIIDENLIGTSYVVARTNVVGNPTFFAVKFFAPIISGQLITTTINVNQFTKFRKVTIGNFDVAEIISVIDSEGNEYYEVPNLSQNIVYRSILNKDNPNSLTKYLLKPISAQRRFVFENENGVPTLTFGGKQYKPDEDLTINPVAEPSKFVLNRYNNDYLQDAFFEPNKLLNGDNFGVGPDNTVLTITYRTNSALNNNASIGEISSIKTLLTQFLTDIDVSDSTEILDSIQMINEEEVIGQDNALTTEEIKNLSGLIYQSQNRAVTAKDYEALSYSMPSKYGSIKRCKAERDPKSLKNNINLYVVSVNNFGNLTTSNTSIKQNLKQWLTGYKMLTDSVDIIDAKIINLGINYTILVDPNKNKLDVNSAVLTQLRNFYNLKPQIGENFSYLDVYREIQKVEGVLDVKSLEVTNITDAGYSPVSFNIKQNESDDGNMIMMPRNAIYEIKNVTTDITGKVV
jgi:hypothetical protein